MAALLRSTMTDIMSTFSSANHHHHHHPSSDQNGNSGLYFLAVHHHSTRTVRFPPEERLTTMADWAIMHCHNLNVAVLQKECERLTSKYGMGDEQQQQQQQQQKQRRRSRRQSTNTINRSMLLISLLTKCIEQLTHLESQLRFLRHMAIVTRTHPMMADQQDPDTDTDTDANDNNVHEGEYQAHDLAYQRQYHQREELSYEDPVNTVSTFNHENRGLMLLVIHTLDKITQRISDLHKVRRRRSSWFFTSSHYLQSMIEVITKCCKQVDIILVISNFAIMVAENRYCYLNHCADRLSRSQSKDVNNGNACSDDIIACSAADLTLKGRRIFFPFADEIDIDNYPEVNELDYSIFMEEMGPQYMPMVGTFFNVLVRTTAAHKSTVSFELKNHYVRQGLLGISQLVYLVDSKSASKECVKFFKEAKPEHTQLLWESLDTGIVQYFNYFTLPPIPTSRVFYIGGPIPSKIQSLSTASMSDQEFDETMQKSQETADATNRDVVHLQEEFANVSTNDANDFIPLDSDDDSQLIHPAGGRDETDIQTDQQGNNVLLVSAMDTMIKAEEEEEEQEKEMRIELGPYGKDDAEKKDVDGVDVVITRHGQTEVGREEIRDSEDKDSDHDHVHHEEYHTRISLRPDIHFDGSTTMEELSKYTSMMPMLLAQDRSLEDLDARLDSVQLRLIAPWNFRDRNGKINAVEDWGLLSKMSRAASSIGKNFFAGDALATARDGCMILHIHGGGFVAMSSYSHESYLRRWAYQCNVPIVSVDYRKAPGQKYPSQLAECYEAYKWIIQNAEHILGQPLKKLIVAGDSAGGNLSMGVCSRAIVDKIRIPDALVLSYPVTLLSSAPSTGRLISLLDPLVNFAFLKMCGDSYLGNVMEEARRDAFISPSVTPMEILTHYPPVYISVGTLDPLFDDAVFMAKRIEKYNGGRVALEVYDGLPHGFLNMVGLVPGGTAANNNVMRWMNEFLDSGFEQDNDDHDDNSGEQDCVGDNSSGEEDCVDDNNSGEAVHSNVQQWSSKHPRDTQERVHLYDLTHPDQFQNPSFRVL